MRAFWELRAISHTLATAWRKRQGNDKTLEMRLFVDTTRHDIVEEPVSSLDYQLAARSVVVLERT